MKSFRVEFEMDFQDKFTDEQIDEWLKYQVGLRGGCTQSELTDDYDLDANYASVIRI